MLKNYLKTSFRHLLKNKSTSAVNISGLVLGITFTIVILVVVQYELSFDSFHTNAERIYRITRVSEFDGQPEYRTGVVYSLTDALRNDLTSIENIAAMQYEGGIHLSLDNEDGQPRKKHKENEGFVFLEPSFFKVFDYKGKDVKWIAGNPETALVEPNSLVLTEQIAKKYFPDEEALGKTILIENQVNFKVTGIVTDFPKNTDFPFKIIASYSTLKGFLDGPSWYGVSDQNQAYVVLKEGFTEAEVNAQIAAIHASNVDERTAAFRKYLLQPLKEVHFDNRFGNYNFRTVSKSTIGALAWVGFFLLMMACINFINITTAQSATRGKEVGIRKVLGGKRNQLVFQFLGETFIITVTATIFSFLVAEIIINSFQNLLGFKLDHSLITDPYIILLALLIVVFVSFLAGFYPALVQSGFNPVNALKGKLSNLSMKGIRLRRGLVSFQLIISQVFIICTIIVIKQMDYFRNADLGFDKEAVITVNLPQNDKEKHEILKDKIESASGVNSVSLSFSFPSGTGRNTSFGVIRSDLMDSPEEDINFEHQSIDENYLKIYKIDLLAGRNLVEADSSRGVILNLHLSKRLGFKVPEDAIGQEVETGDGKFNVVGVTANFHTKSLRDQIDYVAFFYNPSRFYNASIKLSTPADGGGFYKILPHVLSHLEAVYTEAYPSYVFEYRFLDDRIQAFYAEETRISSLFKILAGLSIFIGCLGLYGLVSFMAVKREKEIGIRKVLGASISSIMTLFSKEFLILVFFAFIIAAPLSWYMMQKWLQEFVFKIDIGAEIFLLAGFASLFIAIVTVGYQSLKTSLANPVNSLKSE